MSVTPCVDYLAAVDWVDDLMRETEAGHLGLPTPCSGLDVRQLMGHLVGTAHRALGTARGTSTDDVPHVVTDVPDRRLAAEYGHLAERLHDAWTHLDPGLTVHAPWGDCSATDAAVGFTVETLVHGWDLAEATHRPSDALPEVAERCLASRGPLVPDRLRGVMYDLPVQAPAGASATARLAHHLGRRLRWS